MELRVKSGWPRVQRTSIRALRHPWRSKETTAFEFTTLLKVTGNRFLFRRKQINFYLLRSGRAAPLEVNLVSLLLNTSNRRAASAPKCEPRQSRWERSTRARSEALFLCHGHGRMCFIESENVGQLRSAAEPMPRRGYTFTVTTLTRAKAVITSRERARRAITLRRRFRTKRTAKERPCT